MLMMVGWDGRVVLMVKANGSGYKLNIFTDLVHFSFSELPRVQLGHFY